MKLRRRAVLKWAAAGLCILIFAVWLASGWWAVGVRWHLTGSYRDNWAGVYAGTVGWTRDQYTVHVAPTLTLGPTTLGARPVWNWTPSWFTVFPGTPGQSDLRVFPLWWLLVASAALPAWLYWREHRFGAGECAHCGYDLSGLTPGGVCPECGGKVAAEQRMAEST